MIRLLSTYSTLCAVILLSIFWARASANAHESQPGSLEIRQLSEKRYEITWRAPIYYGKLHPAQLQLPVEWQRIGETVVKQLSDSTLFKHIIDINSGSIDGSIIRFPGLEATITDVFVRVSALDATVSTMIVRPTKPFVELRGKRAWYVSSWDYLILGLHHILMGVDHLLFVWGLMIIVGSRSMLIKTITAFTVAHSITLALATLGYANPPGPPLNAAIALSILFLGPEIVRVWRGQTSVTIRHPWVVAFGFGLLHGFGFASGLSTVGMPKAEIPLALLMFNIGVECGQILFVILIIAIHRSLRVLAFRWPQWANILPGYTIGSLGAFWTIQRAALLLPFS